MHILRVGVCAVLSGLIAIQAEARDQIRAVGSSTVYPFVTSVAEEFGKSTSFKTPIVEATGTGGGFKFFCAGVGDDFPDLANASRPIKTSEVETCRQHNVMDIVEIPIGYDGIVLAASLNANDFALSRKQIFLALARKVPVDGELKNNPYRTWKDIDPSLPDQAIEVYGPPPTSGTRDAFVELVMEKACEQMPEFVRLYPEADKRKKSCTLLREDGVFIEAGEDDNLIVQKLRNNSQAIGIFGFDSLEQNRDLIKAHTVDGKNPSFTSIADHSYPLSRLLFVYVKQAHIGKVSGIPAFIKELTSEKALGDEGYLMFKGLVPLPKKERDAVRKKVATIRVL